MVGVRSLSVQLRVDACFGEQGRIVVDRRVACPALRLVRISSAALTEGVDGHLVDGVLIGVTNVARTVVDCCKCRNKIGLDVALEALREAWRERRLNADDVWRYAKMAGVANVMRPYPENVACGE